VKRTTSELTRAIASGDTEAFAHVYEMHFGMMYNYVQRLTSRDSAFCLDVVQDAMLKVIRSMKPIENDAALHAWLRCVVKTSAYDALRREKRQRQRELRISTDKTDMTNLASSADELDAQLAWLKHELQQLDADTRHLIHLRHRLGWTLQRIGAALGLSTGAVDGRLTRAMQRLKAKAEQLDE